MAKKARNLKTGDRVTIELFIVDVRQDMEIFTVDINGERTDIPYDWDRITRVKSYGPKIGFKHVR